ncbi:MAG TPA: iron-containing alcohol dehydrogenase [Pseudonocardiaceae bacterium]|nr:iron-containing alcohol dehydrogenase [Pseudonocardiaceae bacterium]
MTGSVGISVRALPYLDDGYFGRGVTRTLGAHLDRLGVERLAVVRCGESYGRCGAAERVDDATVDRKVRYLRASSLRTTVEQARAAIDLVRDFHADAVLGIGGGNALDLAKVAATFAHAPDEFDRCLADPQGVRPESRPLRLLLVPTTAGSGSEATGFATLWQGARKISVDGPALRADIALVDPGLTWTTDPSTFASAAVDALAQAVEAGWSRQATPESTRYATESYAELTGALDAITRDGRDAVLEDRLSWGATLAGAAIDIARTTAAHALSYALTYRCGLPHGAAVGLCLPWVIQHNAAIVTPPPSANVDPLRIVAALLSYGRFPTSPAELDIEPSVLRRDWTAVLASDRARNNPRPLRQADVEQLASTVGRRIPADVRRTTSDHETHRRQGD